MAATGKIRPVCVMDGCERLNNAHGYCLAHYMRFKKYGSPTGGGIERGPKGEINKFLDNLFKTETDDCIAWPFSRDDNGYPKMNRDGGTKGVHVHVCTVVHGPRPDGNDACHSCGNGHLACVNWRHLNWGTRLKNVQDSIEHGTDNFFGLGPLRDRVAA